jgi:hypothetical protein
MSWKLIQCVTGIDMKNVLLPAYLSTKRHVQLFAWKANICYLFKLRRMA